MSIYAMVAVCDILGYSNLVKSSSLIELKDFHLKNINNIIKSAIPRYREIIESPSRKEIFQNNLVGHTTFSDTIIFYSLSDDRDGYRNVLNAVYRLIAMPMFTPIYKYRVGISYGEFYHNQKENIYIGKALVEANDLEKVQQWSGAALTEKAAKKFKDNFPENSMLVNYDVPVKLSSESTHRKHSVVNWTLANHTVIRGNQNWMYREENKSEVHSYSNENVEQKILNTEKFHSDICTQCNTPKTLHMNTIEKINTGLRKIRIARLFSYILFFGFVPVSMLLISLDFPVPFSLIPYGILFLLVSSYAALQKCPRCGEFFFWNMDKSVLGYRNPFTNKCLNCKVSIKNNQIST